jgi:phage-related protein
MKSLSAALIEEKNKLHSTDPWLILLDITLPDSTVIRLVRNTEDVEFGGNTYTAFPFDLSIVESNSTGKVPVVTLKVSNITRMLTPHLNSQNGGLESAVTVTIVNAGLLSESYSELDMDFTVMGCESNSEWVTWTLGMANPLNRRFPLYRYLANHCAWTFTGGVSVGVNVECGYTGAFTTCNRTLSDCVARNNTENFGGFLGMQNDGIRIA